MDDPFIRNYIEDLLKNVRTQVLLKLIKPYTRIRIPFISKVKAPSLNNNDTFLFLFFPFYVCLNLGIWVIRVGAECAGEGCGAVVGVTDLG